MMLSPPTAELRRRIASANTRPVKVRIPDVELGTIATSGNVMALQEAVEDRAVAILIQDGWPASAALDVVRSPVAINRYKQMDGEVWLLTVSRGIWD